MPNTKILIMEQFYSQVEDLNLSKKAFDSIREEISLLSRFSTNLDLFSYLKNQNAKKLKGHVHQFKYRMNRGDRIFFTYGKYIENTPEQYRDAIFIYGYSRHETQDQEEIPEYEDGYVYSPSEIEEVIEGDENYIPGFAADDAGSKNITTSSLYIDAHSFFAFDENNIPSDVNNLDVMLSKEQKAFIDEYIDSPKPTLILGGAGTGKTVMGLHILNDFSLLYEESECGYFTQSYPLLMKSAERFKYIIGNTKDRSTEKIHFENLIQYCFARIEKCSGKKLDPALFVENTRFSQFIKEEKLGNVLAKNNIQEYDLWAEIRGTIKGGLDTNWARYEPFNQKDFSGPFLHKLEKHKLIERLPSDTRLFRVSDVQAYDDAYLDFCNAEEDSVYKKIQNCISSVSSEAPLLPYCDYEKISEENSTLDYEQRKLAYSIAEKYQAWLKKNNYFDDNDLILENLKYPVTEEELFEFVMVDEIQDYTELQIYFISRLVKNYRHFVMAGDEHQIVNPTLFSEERLKKLFFVMKAGGNLNINKLQRNYRCPDEIVRVANSLSLLAKKQIASKGENLLIETSYKSAEPQRLLWNKEQNLAFLDELLLYPDVVLIVADNKMKEQLIAEYGSEKYEAANNPIISTVPEIKGMEYKYVVLYNLIGQNEPRWKEILEGKARHTTCYRYFFNSLYVGITRVRQYLCVIDNTKTDLYEQLGTFEICEDINPAEERLALLPKDELAWIRQIEKEINAGKLEKSRILLRNVESTEKKRELKYKIDIQEALSQNDIDRAAHISLLLGDYRLIEKYKATISSKDFLSLYELLSADKIDYEAAGRSGNIIDKLYKDYSEEERLLLKLGILKKLDTVLEESNSLLQAIVYCKR